MTKQGSKSESANAVFLSDQNWLDDMRTHYFSKGFYRAMDLDRVLGAPWDRVVIAPRGIESFSNEEDD